jgi:hypothetical protein
MPENPSNDLSGQETSSCPGRLDLACNHERVSHIMGLMDLNAGTQLKPTDNTDNRDGVGM